MIPLSTGGCNQRIKNEISGRRRKEAASPRRSVQRSSGGHPARPAERALPPR